MNCALQACMGGSRWQPLVQLCGCQRCHLRLNAPVQGLARYVACCCVVFERLYMDIEKLQTHQRFLVTSNGVASPMTALLKESRQLAERVRNCTFLYLVNARFHVRC